MKLQHFFNFPMNQMLRTATIFIAAASFGAEFLWGEVLFKYFK
ncbi:MULTISPECIES: hypothetical protein [Chryseobacterium]|nr:MULTISPECIES: hypothetical protein [Chryseobacterium]MEB4760620.1 hypothetical protein [Chryseobacterium indologenes]SFJ69514.1 hypothetical protein SAMN05421692_2407 [Chryseobacterium indologenes]SUX51930.1 Uncharacterised protein [Chryseobacterium indologenes]VFA42797.1 Uncharacterised protein [Chryseobacterium indologenes]